MEFLDFVYEIDENGIVYAYRLKRDEFDMFLEFINKYHYDIQGDNLINKLRGRGYLEINEAHLKYGVDTFEKRNFPKDRKVKKKLKEKKRTNSN